MYNLQFQNDGEIKPNWKDTAVEFNLQLKADLYIFQISSDFNFHPQS